MRKQKTPSIFMKHLEYYVNTYMPEARGLSKNTINSYKTTFTLLIKYMYSVKNMKADEITFGCLDVNTLSDFIPFNASHAPLQLPEYYQPHYNKPIFYFSCKIKEILA